MLWELRVVFFLVDLHLDLVCLCNQLVLIGMLQIGNLDNMLLSYFRVTHGMTLFFKLEPGARIYISRI